MNIAGLHLATLKGHRTCVQTLVSNGTAIDSADHDGETALHIAGATGDLTRVFLLWAMKANMDAADKMGKTPLHHCIQYRQIGHPKTGKGKH